MGICVFNVQFERICLFIVSIAFSLKCDNRCKRFTIIDYVIKHFSLFLLRRSSLEALLKLTLFPSHLLLLPLLHFFNTLIPIIESVHSILRISVVKRSLFLLYTSLRSFNCFRVVISDM